MKTTLVSDTRPRVDLPPSRAGTEKRLRRSAIILIHDILMAVASLFLALWLRIGWTSVEGYHDALGLAAPTLVAIAGVTFFAFGLYRAVWRYVSADDLASIVKAVTICIAVFTLVMAFAGQFGPLPRSVPLIQWFVLIILLGGMRLAYRQIRYDKAGHSRWLKARTQNDRRTPVLLAGISHESAHFIRALQGDPDAGCRVAAILDDRKLEMRGRSIHGARVLGALHDLAEVIAQLTKAGDRPHKVIVGQPSGRLDDSMLALIEEAQKLGVPVARLPSLVDFKTAVRKDSLELRAIALEDLLERPQASLDLEAMTKLVAGKRVLVTGAGGTIGSELARQIAGLEPAELTLLENSEYNLYRIDLEIGECHPDLASRPVLCDIRDLERVERVFADRRPELIFHAAALKHVPLVEYNPAEGILTNVMGTRNVADMAKRYGAIAMVQVSSDKAVNPTSIMGASKRLAEIYCQTLDLECSQQAGRCPNATRFFTVRFGNVLGSSGSVVPLFQRQLKAGGPLTVTHPDIRRYFMTVREAVELVLHASAYGIRGARHYGQIMVLDMGDPIRIVDIAEKLIRLAGLEPHSDVKIEITGLRPGEKLFEELFDDSEARCKAEIESVLLATSRPSNRQFLDKMFAQLFQVSRRNDDAEIRRIIGQVILGYRRSEVTVEPAAGASTELQGKVAALD